MKNWIFALVASLCLMTSSTVWAELRTGEPAPDFSVTDTGGQMRSLSDHEGQFIVLEWINEECPFVVKFYQEGHMQRWQAELAEQGVAWYLVASSASGEQGHHEAEGWNEIMGDWEVNAEALLLDPEGDLGRAYGAQTTPHMYLIDPDGVLVYQGAIDSVRSANTADIAGATNYLLQAYQEASAGLPVSEPSTKAYGCSVKY